MPLSRSLDHSLLDEVLGGTNYAPLATVYIGLSTTAPAKDGTGITEPTGNGYARVAVTNNATNFPAAVNGVKRNGTVITFPEATGAWGTVTHFIVMSAATGGTVLGYGALTTSKAVAVNDTPNFPANSLSFTMS